MTFTKIRNCQRCTEKNACFRIYAEHPKEDTARCFVWHGDEEKHRVQNREMCHEVVSFLNVSSVEARASGKSGRRIVSYVARPRASKSQYCFDTLVQWVSQYNSEVAELKMSVAEPITTRKRAQKSAKNGGAVIQKKQKLTGIALLDHILAQNALIEQHTPPAPSPQQTAAAPPQREEAASAAPLRRSKRLAERADAGAAEKEPVVPKKRKTAPKNTRKRKLVEEVIPEPIQNESAPHHPVTGTPLEKRRRSFAEDVVQFFLGLSPVQESSTLETLNITHDESPSSSFTWTEFSDRPENPDYDGDEGYSHYEDSLDSCDSEVESLDDADLCPPRVNGWAEDTARRTLSGDFERLPDEPPAIIISEKMEPLSKITVFWKRLFTGRNV